MAAPRAAPGPISQLPTLKSTTLDTMVICGICLLIAIAIVAVTIWIIVTKCDGDLTLMWKERYGKKIESLRGQVVWITGASSGLGEYMAYCFAQGGCKLVLSARRSEELERVKAACLTMGGAIKVKEEDILVLPLDVVDFESHAGAVQKVIDYFNKIDILVNNAGTSQRAKWLDVTLEVDRAMFELNALGPVSLTQQVLPHMLQRNYGQIVVMSSLAGKFGIPHSRSYSGSKFAVHGFFDSLRVELHEHDIGVTLLNPGPTFSNLLVKAMMGKVGEVVGRDMNPSEKRLTTKRCAHLCCVAVANRLYEAWMSLQPLMFITYFTQYAPDTAKWFLVKYGVRKFMNAREGK